MAWLRHKVPETLRLKPAHNSQLGGLKSGGTEIRCRHLRSSKWGVLAEYHKDGRKQPIWILYVQLDIQQRANNKLRYATMSLDFESETRESDGAIVTTYYGPKHIRGPSETRVIHHGAAFDPQVGVGQIMAKLGAINWESTQERVERWHFDAMSKPGRAGDNLFRRIDWTIREARHASDPNHNPEWKLGVVLTHDGNDFMVHPDIDISFKNAHGIFHLCPKTTRTPTKVEPPQKKPEYWHNLLDKTAASLPLDLLKDNLKSVATAKQG